MIKQIINDATKIAEPPKPICIEEALTHEPGTLFYYRGASNIKYMVIQNSNSEERYLLRFDSSNVFGPYVCTPKGFANNGPCLIKSEDQKFSVTVQNF